MVRITLAAARLNAGYTQKEAAEMLGISNKTLCNWEKGLSFPDACQIREICGLYSIPFDCLNFSPNRPL